MKSNELKNSDKCGCGSNLAYKRCCKRKKFKWFKDEKGEIYRRMPLSEKAIEILETLKEDFVRIFGREPGKDDPVFLHQFCYGEEEYENEIAKAMKKANIAPELAYATKKTGLIVSKENEDLLSDADLTEWHDAVEEYYLLESKGKLKPTLYEKALSVLTGEQITLIILMGMYIRDHDSTANKRLMHDYPLAHFFLSSCLIKIFRHLKALEVLHEKEIGGESLGLIRSIYECYIQYSFIKRTPTAASDILAPQIGVFIGTHRFALNREGNINRKKLIEISTGRTFSVPTNYQMLSSFGSTLDIQIYEFLYPYLSEAVHLDVNYMSKIINENGIEFQKVIEINESIKFSTFVTLLILDEIYTHSNPKLKKDLNFACKRIRKFLINFLEIDENSRGDSNSLIKQKALNIFNRRNKNP